MATAAILECDNDLENCEMSNEECMCFSQNDSPSNLDDVLLDTKLSEKSVFSDKPGVTGLVEHGIELNTTESVRIKPYPLPYNMRYIVSQEIDAMLALDVIEESESPYAAPIVLVRKKDGTNRFCIDYRVLNRITVFDPEPMPQANDIYVKLNDAKFLSKIDLCKGFWQIAMKREDRHKTAFVSPDRGCYQFKRMPFGLKNSPATFNRAMRKLLHGMLNVSSYIDDILVHTRTWSEHLEALEELFGRIHDAGLTVKPSKSMFGFDSWNMLVM